MKANTDNETKRFTFKISWPKVYKMERFVYSRLLQSINLEIQTAFQVSRPIKPFQTILGKRVNGLVDTLKPKEISPMYKRWCVLYHLEKQTDRLAEERRERKQPT